MRYKEGQNIIVTFSDENVFRCKIISINDQSIEIKLEENNKLTLNYLRTLQYVVV